jgi:hypothetical protein
MEILPENSLILVAVIPAVKDLEIARLLGWYRIPLRLAPKIIDVDYLAFFQTGNFGLDHRWRIETIADVRGHELVKRRDLLRDQPDHPRANEEYYKLQLGPLKNLSDPIVAGKWKRITFFYSLGSLMNRARIVNDLVVQTDERAILWQTLRDRSKSNYKINKTKNETETGFNLTPEFFSLLSGLDRIGPQDFD